MRPTHDFAASRYLMSLPKFGRGVGLHRMLWLLDRLQADLPAAATFDAIKVTGSNGKGSVCAFLGAILLQLEAQPGVYTSPHLFDFSERIRLAGVDISPADLDLAVDWYREVSAEFHSRQPGDCIGAFEAFTAVALYHYARCRASTLVLEAGIGGRYDSTRVVPGQLTALTSLDLEHTELLGATLELIAYDKLDLCPEGGTVVTGPLDTDLRKRVEGYCRLRRVEHLSVDDATSVESVEFRETRMFATATVEGRRWANVEIGLLGQHQVSNALLAVLLARRWQKRVRPDLTEADFESAVRNGLARARWAGRFEKISADPEVFIDVGHSPAAADALVRTARACLAGNRILLVTGVSHNKAVEPILSRLAPLADEVICTRAHHKGAPVETIAAVVRRERPDVPLSCAATIEQAAEAAVARARQTGMTILVGGGLFLATEFREALQGRDPRALCLF